MRTTGMAVAAAALLAAACGSEAEGGGSGGGGAGGSGGTGATALAGIGWKQAESGLPVPVDHHATWAMATPAGTFLYEAGGATNGEGAGFRDEVHRAPIGDGGEVGSWEEIAPLPGAQAGAALAVVGRTVVLAGGHDGAVTKAVHVGRTGDDGLVAWSSGPDLPAARFHAAGASSGSSVLVIGGVGEDFAATNTIYRSRVKDDGTLEAWETIGRAPEPISHTAVAVHEGFLWVTGGIAGNPTGDARDHGKVWRVPIGEDGTLGDWQRAGELPRSRAAHALAVVEGSLVVSGGVLENSAPTDSVIAAAITPAGLGAWKELSPLPMPRSHTHHTPVVGGRVYTVGGMSAGRSLDVVLVGTPE